MPAMPVFIRSLDDEHWAAYLYKGAGIMEIGSDT